MTLNLNTIDELLFALSQCARMKYDVDNNKATIKNFEILKDEKNDKSLYKVKC